MVHKYVSGQEPLFIVLSSQKDSGNISNIILYGIIIKIVVQEETAKHSKNK